MNKKEQMISMIVTGDCLQFFCDECKLGNSLCSNYGGYGPILIARVKEQFITEYGKEELMEILL